MLKRLSNKQLIKVFRRLHRKIRDKFAGGTRFGIDWPTLACCYPAYAKWLKAIIAEGKLRGL